MNLDNFAVGEREWGLRRQWALQLNAVTLGGLYSMGNNVSEEALKEYLRIFNRVYAEKMTAAVPPKYREQAMRWGHCTQDVVGYLSTTWGVGYEYVPGPGSIEVVRSSARVEEMLFNVQRGSLERASAAIVGPHRVQLSFCSFTGQLPCRLDHAAASALLDGVRIEYRGRVKALGFAEMFGDRSLDFWRPEKAVERAMDEVLQTVVGVHEVERRTLPMEEYLDRYKQRHVLVLGDFSTEGRGRLGKICGLLGQRGYSPILLDEIKELPEYDLRQKLLAVAAVCRFVVVDDSSRAGHLAEIGEIEKLRAIMIVLRKRETQSTYVLKALEATSKIIKEMNYDFNDLDARMDEATTWAEERVLELGVVFKDTFPWRR